MSTSSVRSLITYSSISRERTSPTKLQPNFNTSVLLYRTDGIDLVVKTDLGLYTFAIFQEDQVNILPCIATHPNVTVSLIRSSHYSINSNLPVKIVEVL